MKANKIFLTSAVCMCMALPSYADIASNANSATCDNSTIGATEGSTGLEAQWTAQTFSEPAGQYLLFANDTVTQHQTCPANSYCPGFTNQTFNDASMGISACPNGYANSASGSSAQAQCYNPGTATCSTRNPYSGVNSAQVTNVVYGNSTNGSASCKTYYGDTSTCVLDTANACEITDLSCAAGYSKKMAVVAKTPLINVDTSINGTGSYSRNYTSDSDTTNVCWELTCNNGSCSGSAESCSESEYSDLNDFEWKTDFGYGTVYGRASCQASGNAAGIYINQNMDSVLSGSMEESSFVSGLASIVGATKAQLIVDIFTRYTSGTITYDEASAEVSSIYYIDEGAQYTTTDTGQYCYCQLSGYKPTSGSLQSVASPSWVFLDDRGSASHCADGCAYFCANLVQVDSVFRSALFGSLGASLSCQANTIDITWDPKNGESTTTNQCTYGGAVTIPATPSKAGYTFGGWRIKPTTPAE